MANRLLFLCKRRLTPYGPYDLCSDTGPYSPGRGPYDPGEPDPSDPDEPAAYAGYAAFGLINSAQFVVNALVERGMDASLVVVGDSNEIDREVTRVRPTHVICEAIWVPPYKFLQLIARHPSVQFIVRIHSNIPFIAQEGIALEWLKSYDPRVRVGANSQAFASDCGEVLDRAITYQPNIYFPDEEVISSPRSTVPNSIHIGCFGAIRPLKNQLEQAVAAITFADSLEKQLFLYINGSRVEQGGAPILKNMRALFAGSRHRLIETAWRNHTDFSSLIASMDLSMQVSFSETFNIVTADAVHGGVPVVVSSQIEWVPRFFQAETTDTSDIVRKMNRAYIAGALGAALNTAALRHWNRQATRIWLNLYE